MACTSNTANEIDHTSPTVRPRLNSIDLLRGLVIVLMALDHTRDFFGTSGQNPRDIAQPALFLTRWITHFCAPTFILLAGVSTYLYSTHGRNTREISWFLLTRGLWLIFIEFTVVGFGWNLGFVEGLNNKIRVIQRRAYGLRDEEYLKLKILTSCLPELK